MKRFVYFYYGEAIPKSQFIAAVPENWQNELNEYGEYTWGGFRASELEDDEEND